ncbi:unnamed protein product [Caenorhabditis sp. 36 PRJEB53466]|nr:unnamed protein product [Caenorhabditis sp. 36 PRJEB53466]
MPSFQDFHSTIPIGLLNKLSDAFVFLFIPIQIVTFCGSRKHDKSRREASESPAKSPNTTKSSDKVDAGTPSKSSNKSAAVSAKKTSKKSRKSENKVGQEERRATSNKEMRSTDRTKRKKPERSNDLRVMSTQPSTNFSANEQESSSIGTAQIEVLGETAKKPNVKEKQAKSGDATTKRTAQQERPEMTPVLKSSDGNLSAMIKN